jgi:hypothetical protein
MPAQVVLGFVQPRSIIQIIAALSCFSFKEPCFEEIEIRLDASPDIPGAFSRIPPGKSRIHERLDDGSLKSFGSIPLLIQEIRSRFGICLPH